MPRPFDQRSSPEFLSYATTLLADPAPEKTTTVSSKTSGELENPHSGTPASTSLVRSRCHIEAPLPGSMHWRVPVAPSANNRPSENVGVALGPGPAMVSWKRVGNVFTQTSRPSSSA